MSVNVNGGSQPSTCDANHRVTREVSMPSTPPSTRSAVAMRANLPAGRATTARKPSPGSQNRTARYREHVIDVTDATFEQDILARSEQVPVVVDLWAPWCGPCQTLGPIIETVVAETGGRVELAKINIDENPGAAQAFNVQSIPAVFALKDRKVVDSF